MVVGVGMLRARFGPWHVQTPLSNITGVEVQGPYAYVKTAGPPHLTFSDRGLTFASNGDRGVFVELREKVRGHLPVRAADAPQPHADRPGLRGPGGSAAHPLTVGVPVRRQAPAQSMTAADERASPSRPPWRKR